MGTSEAGRRSFERNESPDPQLGGGRATETPTQPKNKVRSGVAAVCDWQSGVAEAGNYRLHLVRLEERAGRAEPRWCSSTLTAPASGPQGSRYGEGLRISPALRIRIQPPLNLRTEVVVMLIDAVGSVGFRPRTRRRCTAIPLRLPLWHEVLGLLLVTLLMIGCESDSTGVPRGFPIPPPSLSHDPEACDNPEPAENTEAECRWASSGEIQDILWLGLGLTGNGDAACAEAGWQLTRYSTEPETHDLAFYRDPIAGEWGHTHRVYSGSTTYERHTHADKRNIDEDELELTMIHEVLHGILGGDVPEETVQQKAEECMGGPAS